VCRLHWCPAYYLSVPLGVYNPAILFSGNWLVLDTLLTTKLYIPPRPPSLVPRKRLADRLSDGTRTRLVLVSAPAGFGKTILLGDWARDIKWPNVWVSLDQDDDDLLRFLTYVIVSLQKAIGHDFGELILAGFQATQQPSVESTLSMLINEAASVPEDFVLILDDYHLVEQPSIHQALTFLLEHLPPQMHLVIASRSDPPLPLARLRVRGELVEIRDGDLRFTPEETAVFLKNVMDLELSPLTFPP